MNIEHQSILNPYVIEVFYIHEQNVPYPVGTHFPRRVVRFYELELITGGSGTIITNGETTHASKGDIFLRVPGTVVEGYSGYYFIVVVFDAVYDISYKNLYSTTTPYWVTNEKEMLSNIGIFNDVPYKINTFNNEFEPLFQIIFNAFVKNHQNNQLVLKAHLMNIFHLLFISPERINNKINTRSFENNFALIKNSQDYIDKNLHENFTLSSLAEMCCISKNYYCKLFKKIIGLSPFDYITQSRINAAKKLLTTTNLKITDISRLCGINDITYFYKIFKKHVHMTPADFRERYSFTPVKNLGTVRNH